jgi:hypothetical protein
MSGFSNYLRNKLIDWYMRDQTHLPPANFYVDLCSTAPTAGSPGVSLSGTGYARQAVAKGLANWAGTQADASTTASSGTTGVTSNNAAVNFGTAGSAWGTASHWQVWDALTGGNLLFWGEIVNGAGVATPRVINSSDPVSFPASALRVTWA